MADPLVNATFTLLFALSAVLGGFLLWQGMRAYRVTRRPFLLPFSAGFALLLVASLFSLLNRFAMSRAFYHDTLWVQETAQLVAFGLLAASYRLEGRREERSVPVALGSLGALGASWAAFLALPPDVAFPARMATAQYLYALGILALLPVLLHLSRSGRPTRPVAAGFAVLALGQGAWVGWALTDALPWLLLANGAFVAGLAVLVAAIQARGAFHGAD